MPLYPLRLRGILSVLSPASSDRVDAYFSTVVSCTHASVAFQCACAKLVAVVTERGAWIGREQVEASERLQSCACAERKASGGRDVGGRERAGRREERERLRRCRRLRSVVGLRCEAASASARRRRVSLKLFIMSVRPLVT